MYITTPKLLIVSVPRLGPQGISLNPTPVVHNTRITGNQEKRKPRPVLRVAEPHRAENLRQRRGCSNGGHHSNRWIVRCTQRTIN